MVGKSILFILPYKLKNTIYIHKAIQTKSSRLKPGPKWKTTGRNIPKIPTKWAEVHTSCTYLILSQEKLHYRSTNKLGCHAIVPYEFFFFLLSQSSPQIIFGKKLKTAKENNKITY